ncbi:MAG: ectoine hydroxylase [Rhodospirillales bacterium]|nr:ectoine hydroxylase [Rhodospirillales bacterium]
MTDLYPSRVAPRPELRARHDPVVYGTAETGPLPSASLSRYERNGYLAFDQLLPESEVRDLRAELDRLWAWAGDAKDETIIREPSSQEVRSVFAIHRGDGLFARLAADRRIVGMAEQILGGPVYIHQSRVNFKKGFTGKEFYWHSDFETWHVEDGMPRMRAFSLSIALTDNLPHNGPLMVIPGSHRRYVACVGTTPEDHYKASLRRQEYGVPDEESLVGLVAEGGLAAPTGKAGAAVLFDCNTMHGSNSNITPLPRSNIFIVYNSVENALVAPFGGHKPRPEFVATRNATPLTAA